MNSVMNTTQAISATSAAIDSGRAHQALFAGACIGLGPQLDDRPVHRHDPLHRAVVERSSPFVSSGDDLARQARPAS